jgi:hypothetical protein
MAGMGTPPLMPYGNPIAMSATLSSERANGVADRSFQFF